MNNGNNLTLDSYILSYVQNRFQEVAIVKNQQNLNELFLKLDFTQSGTNNEMNNQNFFTAIKFPEFGNKWESPMVAWDVHSPQGEYKIEYSYNFEHIHNLICLDIYYWIKSFVTPEPGAFPDWNLLQIKSKLRHTMNNATNNKDNLKMYCDLWKDTLEQVKNHDYSFPVDGAPIGDKIPTEEYEKIKTILSDF